ncbi:unnamed protein product, partial [Rotaria socialis]
MLDETDVVVVVADRQLKSFELL